MESRLKQQKNPSNQQGLNPNWALLQQKLHSHGSKPHRPSNNSLTETQKTILGKRKDRPDAELVDSQINPLIPINDDSSLTDVIAMDCEMVGVGQGNKSALGRVSLKAVADITKGRILVGHALHNDLKVLLLSHPKMDLRDTSEYQPFLKEGGKRALRYLAAEFLGVQIQNGEHCPVSSLTPCL
uniref:Exonuclease domain-containing protein n=1 Tax=Fagus sylvatica TaxID=28930 RepID=A0A2N9HET4_FAGSY